MLSTLLPGAWFAGKRKGMDSNLSNLKSMSIYGAPATPDVYSQNKKSGEQSKSNLGHILALYGNSGSDERRQSMQELIDDSVNFLQSVRQDGFPPEIQSLLESSMVDVTNRAYCILESIALELNDALGPSELWLSCTPPQFVCETLKFDRMRRPLDTVTTFRARISSNFFSIVLRAKTGKVDFLLIPSDRAVGLTKIEANYDPLMTFTGRLREDCVEWEVENKPLTDGRLQKYCIEFFKYFLEETRKHIAKPPIGKPTIEIIR